MLHGADNHELVKRLRENHGYIAVSEKYDTPLHEPTAVDNEHKLSVDVSISGFTPKAISNLYRIVKSKEALIKKALGISAIPIVMTETTLKFPWFKKNINEEKLNMYTEFITALCEMAKRQIRATNNEPQIQSEKYVFRGFLNKLGFVGSEHKEFRKKMLANLSGDAAYKDKQNRRRPPPEPY